MKKITRKQADKIQVSLDVVIATLRAQMEVLNALPITDALTSAWNTLCDQVRELENEKYAVEQAYGRRNWDSQDWQLHALVSENRD